MLAQWLPANCFHRTLQLVWHEASPIPWQLWQRAVLNRQPPILQEDPQAPQLIPRAPQVCQHSSGTQLSQVFPASLSIEHTLQQSLHDAITLNDSYGTLQALTRSPANLAGGTPGTSTDPPGSPGQIAGCLH